MVERIQLLCASKDIKIAQLERATGIGNGRISKWDLQDPGISKVSAVADYFNVSLDYLAGREREPLNLTADETELLQLFRQMSDKERQRLIGRAETIVDQEKENTKSLTSKVG